MLGIFPWAEIPSCVYSSSGVASWHVTSSHDSFVFVVKYFASERKDITHAMLTYIEYELSLFHLYNRGIYKWQTFTYLGSHKSRKGNRIFCRHRQPLNCSRIYFTNINTFRKKTRTNEQWYFHVHVSSGMWVQINKCAFIKLARCYACRIYLSNRLVKIPVSLFTTTNTFRLYTHTRETLRIQLCT